MTTENASETTSRGQKLPDRDKAKLWRFLQGMEDEIKAKKLSPIQLVPIVKESIGIEATRDNVRHALNVCDLPIFRKVVNKGVRKNHLRDTLDAQAVRIDQLESRCAKLQADMDAMQKLVEETVKSLTRRWEMVGGKAVPK